jgi:glutamate/tyrosine decarboxylase-like PLP-dependent enzyme
MNVWEDVQREIDELANRIRALPVVSPVSAKRLREEVESLFDFRTPMPLDDVARIVSGLFRSSHVQVTHPRYFGLFNPSVREAGVVADTLAALYNPQLAAWSHSPAASELERLTLRYFAAALGLAPDATFATFTSGGQEANMSAVLVALAERFPDAARSGLSVTGDPVIYVTSESHHSFVKIAKMSGMGTRALSEVAITTRFTVDVEALRRQLDADLHRGRHPLMIVGTAGTTGGGTVDPLAALAEVAAAFKVWFHVDAAWGGAAALVPRLRPILDGIDRANSVTWDAHKWLSVPMGAGMFFCSAPDAVRRAFGVSTTYMPESAGIDTFDPYLTTMQWSRRAIGLKVFMTLAELGAAGLADQIDGQARMGDRLRLLLRNAGWSIVNDSVLPLVCFTHPDIRANRFTTTTLLRELYARGKVWISDVVLGGTERVLRACITSFRTEERDVACLVEELEVVRSMVRRE